MRADAVLNELIQYQREAKTVLYFVGGIVRDFYLDRSTDDIDLTFDGSATELAEYLSERGLNVFLSEHETLKFDTVDGYHFDIATMRHEWYEAGALHQEPSGIDLDLRRRDFTVNAAYAVLNPMTLTNEKGEWTLYQCHPLFRHDLACGQIRVLHEASFREDPTRLFRAVKLSLQLDFDIELKTEDLMRNAFQSGYDKRISNGQMRILLERLFNCVDAARGIMKLNELGWTAVKQGVKDLENDYLSSLNMSEEDQIRILMARCFIEKMEWLYSLYPQLSKLHQAYLKIHESLALFLNNPEKNDYMLFKILYNKKVEILELLSVNYEDAVKRYRENLLKYAIHLNGDILKGQGVQSGRGMGLILERLQEEKINNRLQMTLEDEIKYIERFKDEY